MPIKISNCGDRQANGIYYQRQLNPPHYVKDDQTHEIRGQGHYLSASCYGSNYSTKVYVISKLDACHSKSTALYVSRMCSFHTSPTAPQLRWSSVTGAAPMPQLEEINPNNQLFTYSSSSSSSRSNMSRKRTFGMYCNESEELTDSRSSTMDMDTDGAGGENNGGFFYVGGSNGGNGDGDDGDDNNNFNRPPPIKRVRFNPTGMGNKQENAGLLFNQMNQFQTFDWSSNFTNQSYNYNHQSNFPFSQF